MTEEYYILNTVKPKYYKTAYPYNLVDPEKIIFTQKKIKILAKSFNSKIKSNQKKGGADSKMEIVFYG